MNKLLKYLSLILWMIIISCGQSSNKSSPELKRNYKEIKYNIPVGIAMYSFNRFPFPETLDKSKQAGTEIVEGFFFHNLGEAFKNKSMLDLNDEELRKMKKFIEDKGLRMPSVYAGAKTREEWIRFFEIGKILDLDFLVCEPKPPYWNLLDSLSGVSGIKIAIHEHARGKSIFWHPDSVLAAIEGHENFGACGDLGHWVRSGLDPVECLKKLDGHLISIHAKDLDEFGNIDANDVKVGSGVIDYHSVMEELKRQNFDGPIYIECEHDWENNLEDVNYAVKYIMDLWN